MGRMSRMVRTNHRAHCDRRSAQWDVRQSVPGMPTQGAARTSTYPAGFNASVSTLLFALGLRPRGVGAPWARAQSTWESPIHECSAIVSSVLRETIWPCAHRVTGVDTPFPVVRSPQSVLRATGYQAGGHPDWEQKVTQMRNNSLGYTARPANRDRAPRGSRVGTLRPATAARRDVVRCARPDREGVCTLKSEASFGDCCVAVVGPGSESDGIKSTTNEHRC